MRRILVVGIAAAAWAATALPGAAVVTKAVLSAIPGTYRGDCPGVIKFKGTITVSGPATVHYVFTRSDGATDTNLKSLTFKGAGTQAVETSWTLGGSGLPFYEGWEAIKILGSGETSSQAKFELRCDPPLNSARAAHGNTDWHLQTANEFLFGTDMNGSLMAPNHAPDGWNRKHIHVGLTDSSKYYFDRTVLPAGADTDPSQGIDVPMLFFYAGHGNALFWSTLGGGGGTEKDVKLANVAQGGTLRYYWQCSCQVFAHGPLCPSTSGESPDYACPQSWSGEADSGSVRNVFERWGPALTPDLRMACGMSTLAYCHEYNVDHVWNDYNNQGMSVAESFIDGFGDFGVVPLCITLGGADITQTPLYDAAFTNRPNTSGSSHYHILYAAGSESEKTPGPHRVLPAFLPKLAVVPAALTAKLPGLDLRSARPVVSLPLFAGGKAVARVQPASGALHLVAVEQRPAVERPLAETEYRARALAAVRDLGWNGEEVGEPEVTRLLSASMPVGGKAGDVKQSQQSVTVRFRRQIAVGGQKVEVLGEGGTLHLALSNGGQVTRASRVWRQVRAASAPVRVKTFEEARAAAEKQLDKPELYELGQWRWGYKELAGNVKQDELVIVFQLAFVPRDRKDLTDHPPRLIEIAGQD